MYSYVLLSFLMVVTYHILRSFNPDWAFIPAAAIGAWVFRSRIKLLVKFMKMLYLDKKERLRGWFTPVRSVALAGAIAIALLVPIWPDFEQGPLFLAPPLTAVFRPTVPRNVTAVSARECDMGIAGTPLVRRRHL